LKRLGEWTTLELHLIVAVLNLGLGLGLLSAIGQMLRRAIVVMTWLTAVAALFKLCWAGQV